MAADLRRRSVLCVAFFIALLAFSQGSHPSHEIAASYALVLVALWSGVFIWHLLSVRRAAAALVSAATDIVITGLCIGPAVFFAYFVAVFQTN